MRYVTSIERLAIEEGEIKNSRKNTIDILETRFGNVPESLVEKINSIDKLAILETLFRRAILIESVEAFEQFLEQTLSAE